MSRVVILPIISFIALLLNNFFGIEISKDLQNDVVDLILTAVFVVTGIITALRTRKKKSK